MITIQIDEQKKIGKLLISLIKETKCGKIIKDKKKESKKCVLSHTPNAETIQAFKDAEAGKTKRFKTINE